MKSKYLNKIIQLTNYRKNIIVITQIVLYYNFSFETLTYFILYNMTVFMFKNILLILIIIYEKLVKLFSFQSYILSHIDLKIFYTHNINVGK